jgi:predicted RNA-binding protein with PUA-like domain
MSYWIFKTDPKQYRIDERLKDPDPETSWRVTRYKDEIRQGDIVFIWRTGNNRGICAVMRIDTLPEERTELESEQKYNTQRDTQLRMRVEGAFTHRFDCISHKELKAIPELENLSVLSKQVYQSGTNFKVTEEEGDVIMKLIEARNGK